MSSIAHSSHMDIFQNLAVDLETEGRYLFLNCIANQLRQVYRNKFLNNCQPAPLCPRYNPLLHYSHCYVEQ